MNKVKYTILGFGFALILLVFSPIAKAQTVDWDTTSVWWTGASVPASVSGSNRYYFYSRVTVGIEGWLSQLELRLKQNSGGCASSKPFRVEIRSYSDTSPYGRLLAWSDYMECNTLPTYSTSPVPLTGFVIRYTNTLSDDYFRVGDKFWVGIAFTAGSTGTSQNILFGQRNLTDNEQLNCTDEACTVAQYTNNFYPFEVRTYMDEDSEPPITPDLPELTACLPHNYVPQGSSGDTGTVETIIGNIYQYSANIPVLGDLLFLDCVIYKDFYENLETMATTDLDYHVTAFNIDSDESLPLELVKSSLETWVSGITGYEAFRTTITTVIWCIILFGLFLVFIFPEIHHSEKDEHDDHANFDL